MCGIAGLWMPDIPIDDLKHRVVGMTDLIRHRGPDSEGLWADPEGGIVLGHRRLAIVDLSMAGAQPMPSNSGRYAVAFNGEIYNHLSIRHEIETVANIRWRGSSDTETLIEAIDLWGIEATLERIDGMFAFAIWDRAQRELVLARDRLGEKPLHVWQSGQCLAFASELKGFGALPDFPRRPDPGAVRAFLEYGYVPDDRSIFAGVRKVPPGRMLRWQAPTATADSQSYWSIRDVARSSRMASATDPLPTVEALLQDVVASQMLSDVPLGAFLSGGIDSSLITALMQQASQRPVRSFSIGFADARFDESAHAAAVARHLGTEHTEFIVTEADALAIIPDLPKIYDEPFADSSQLPTALLCRLARQHVTVALTGDGGDEVFGGYNRYLFAPRVWRRFRHVPRPIRSVMARFAGWVQRSGQADGSLIRHMMTSAGLPLTTVDKLARTAAILHRANGIEDVYAGLIRTFDAPDDYLLATPARKDAADAAFAAMADISEAEWMMVMDSLGYLPGDILVKVDRAAMNASLETRAPFLDRRVVEQSWRLASDARIQDGQGKMILRRILDRHVPRTLIDRPKQGFSIPIDRWLSGDLAEWADALLSTDRLLRANILDPAPVRRLWLEHVNGKARHGQMLWTVLMLQMWTEYWLGDND